MRFLSLLASLILFLSSSLAFAGDFQTPQMWEQDLSWSKLTTQIDANDSESLELAWYVQPNTSWDDTLYEQPSYGATKHVIPHAREIMQASTTPYGNPLAFQSSYLEKRVVGKHPWFRVEMNDPKGDQPLQGWLPAYDERGQLQVTTRYGSGC